MVVVFDRMLLKFSPLLCLQAAVEHKLITALTCGDKREEEDDGFMVLGS